MSASAVLRLTVSAVRGYIPGLQYEGGVVKFLLNRGFTVASPAALNNNHERLVTELDAPVAASGVPVVRFKRDDYKEDIARPYQDQRLRPGATGWCSWARHKKRQAAGGVLSTRPMPATAPATLISRGRGMSPVPDHWYFYFADEAWGPAFLKMCSYAPYAAVGHGQRPRMGQGQLARSGVAYTALDNGLVLGRRPRPWHSAYAPGSARATCGACSAA